MRKDFLYFVFNNGEISNTFYVLEIISTRSKDADMGNVRRNVYIYYCYRENSIFISLRKTEQSSNKNT